MGNNKVEVKNISIPLMAEHQGYHSINVNVKWLCPKCGGPRGTVYKTDSFDGSMKLRCDGWVNSCGHVDKYAAVREEARSNGLNRPVNLISPLASHIKEIEVSRDKNGWWTHPELPEFGDSSTVHQILEWFKSNHIKPSFILMSDDCQEGFVEKWFDEGLTNCSPWTPTPPNKNSFLLSIHDTEDGPVAWFATPSEGYFNG